MAEAPYSMSKDAQKLNLETVTRLRVGAAWEASGSGTKGLMGKWKKFQGVDLDLLCVASKGPSAKRLCWFDSKSPFPTGSLVLGKDTKSGRGDGDDEEIIADLLNIPMMIDRLTWIVMAYKPEVNFTQVSNVTVTIYDDVANTTRGEFMPDLGEHKNAIVACQAVRVAPNSTNWGVVELNEMVQIPVNGNFGSDQPSIIRIANRYADAR